MKQTFLYACFSEKNFKETLQKIRSQKQILMKRAIKIHLKVKREIDFEFKIR